MKALQMPSTERLSVSIDKQRAKDIRLLVENGAYSSISAAIDAATTLLIQERQEEERWWAETIRRCEEAERHPERLLDAATFHDQLWERIERIKAVKGSSK